MMTFNRHALAVIPALGLVYALGATPAAMAQSTSAMSESAGATTGLGTHHRFPTADAASAHCPGDTIVWSSGGKMTYHLSSSSSYGKTGHGFYACKMEADDAGFHPASD